MTATVEEQEKRYDELVEKLADVVVKDWDVLMDKNCGFFGEFQWQTLWDDVMSVLERADT